MDHTTGTSHSPLSEPEAMRYVNDYVRRLLIERHHIYARLLNPGGSIILNAKSRADSESGDGYASMIGSSFHLDMMELDMALKQSGLKPHEIQALLTWVDGMTSQQAAVYLSARGSITSKTIQKRRERALEKLTRKMNDG